MASLAVAVGFVTFGLLLAQSASGVLQHMARQAAGSAELVVRAAPAGGSSDPGQLPPVPDGLRDRVAKVAGVGLAEEFLVVPALVAGSRRQPLGDGAAWVTSWRDGLEGSRRTGTAPEDPGQVVVDDAKARSAGIGVGDELEIRGPANVRRFLVVGTAAFGAGGAAPIAAVSLGAAQELRGGGSRASAISVHLDDPHDLAKVMAGLRTVLPHGYEAVPTAEFGEGFLARSEADLGFFTTGLIVLGAACLAMTGFLVRNTVTISALQRSRELGLLRVAGASSRQVAAALLGETAAAAIVAGVVGTALGIVGNRVAVGAITVAGVSLDRVPPLGAAVALPGLAGVALAVLTTLGPVRRAGRVTPLAALRDADSEPLPVSGGIWRAVAAFVGLMLVVYGGLTHQLRFVVPGALALVVGVVLAAPVLVAVAVRSMTPLTGALGGVGALIGARDASRNARRTALTTLPVVASLGLVVLVAVLAGSVRATASHALDDFLVADYFFGSKTYDPLPPSLASELGTHPAVSAVSSLRLLTIDTGSGPTTPAMAISPESDRLLSLKIIAGSRSALDRGDILISESTARARGLGLQDPVEIGLAGSRVQLRVGGVFATTQIRGYNYLLSTTVHGAYTPAALDNVVLINAAPTASNADVARLIDEITMSFPGVVARDRDAYAAQQARQIDQLLVIVVMLLGVSALVAVLGVANTISLSLVGRRRELALLQAVGMDRRQLAAMTLSQGLLTSILGTAAAVLVGGGIAVAVVQGMAPLGLLQGDLPLGLVALAGVATVVASATASLLSLRGHGSRPARGAS